MQNLERKIFKALLGPKGLLKRCTVIMTSNDRKRIVGYLHALTPSHTAGRVAQADHVIALDAGSVCWSGAPADMPAQYTATLRLPQAITPSATFSPAALGSDISLRLEDSADPAPKEDEDAELTKEITSSSGSMLGAAKIHFLSAGWRVGVVFQISVIAAWPYWLLLPLIYTRHWAQLSSEEAAAQLWYRVGGYAGLVAISMLLICAFWFIGMSKPREDAELSILQVTSV